MSRQLKSGEVVEKCAECKWEYPDVGYLSQLFIGGKGYTKPICGLCALEISNRELGVNRKRFSGVMAEEHRQDAFHWRKKHPELKPK
jgi:hypothetical protein